MANRPPTEKNTQALTNSRIRARPTGLVSPLTQRPVFRIEDQTGTVLRRIGSARSTSEAMAHYWRTVGCDARFLPAMPEPPSDAILRRRIDAARGRGPAGRDAMQTHELPLAPSMPVEPTADDDAAADIAAESAPVMRKPAAPRRREPREILAVDDLFEAREPAASQEPDAASVVPMPEPEAEASEPRIDPPVAQEPVPEPEPESKSEPEPEPVSPYHLDPHAVMLQQVDHRNLRPTDRADSYLYHITNRAEARGALESGLVVSAQDPVILTERQGVAYWLSVLAEDFDVILDGPADFVVLRMRRIMVEELLEPDPDASRSAGCACYLLTGGAGG